jgi:CRP/FNR family transcriptional regulator, anaerobic regulatory protein
MILTNTKILAFLDLNYIQEQEETKLVSLEKNKTIVEQGKLHKYLYVIKEGIVKCSITEDNNKSYTLEFLGVGEIIGEIETLLKCKNLATIKSLTQCLLYKIEIDHFNKILLNDPAFNRLLMIELATRLQNTAARASSQQLYTLQVSLKNLLFLLDKQSLKFNKSDLAEYLGISIRSLNRELKNIKH